MVQHELNTFVQNGSINFLGSEVKENPYDIRSSGKQTSVDKSNFLYFFLRLFT